jgi:hypothetical protein
MKKVDISKSKLGVKGRACRHDHGGIQVPTLKNFVAKIL